MNQDRHYNAVAKLLHWLIGLAIVGMIGLGWWMESMHPDNRFQLFQLHKSIGITILLLSLFRLYWRLTHPAPPYPVAMKNWEKFAAKSVAVLFYVLMIGIPMLGWIIVSSSTRDIPTILYGIIPWPHLPVLPTLDVDDKKEIGHIAATLHSYLAYSVLGLLALHVGAALKHHFIVKDDVLTGMAPNFLKNLLHRLRGTSHA